MKTISVNVSEPVYRAFRDRARALDRPAAELIREAMETYRRSWHTGTSSLRDLAPLSLGKVKPGALRTDDLLGEMLDGRRG